MSSKTKSATTVPTISFSELMAEVEKCRQMPMQREFTPEQDNFILACRNHQSPVRFPKMLELWKKAGWGDICEGALRNRYRKLMRK
jgi:hypothetical protein